VDGCSTDTEQPEGTTGLGSAADQFPDGTEIWGRVVYDQEDNKLVQYKCTWDKATNTFVENETPEDIVTAVSHASQH